MVCFQTGVNYQYTCKLCKEVVLRKYNDQEDQEHLEGDENEDMIGQYRGETSKTPFTRNEGHVSKWKTKKGSFIFDHGRKCKGVPEGRVITPDDFIMEVIKSDRCPLRRVLREAVRIRDGMEEEDIKLNDQEEDIEGAISREIEARIELLNSKREFYLPVIGASRLAGVADRMAD